MLSQMKNHYALYMELFNLAIFINFVNFYEVVKIDTLLFRYWPFLR